MMKTLWRLSSSSPLISHRATCNMHEELKGPRSDRMYVKRVKRYAPYLAMVVIQLAYGGSNILMKIALEKGLNVLAFIVYRHVIAMIVLGPFAYALERKRLPSLSFPVALKIFVIASLGTTIHLNVYYLGLDYTSPTVASALSNVIPGLTFITALLFRMENVRLKSIEGKAKVLGTLICIGGSLIFTFWKGGCLCLCREQRPLIQLNADGVKPLISKKDDWIKGAILILLSYFAWSAWITLQAVVYKMYPAGLSLNILICFFASLQSSFLAIFLARDSRMWKLDWDVKLLTIVYCGVVVSGMVYYLQTWCINEKGPVFASMFSPLLLVVVGIFSTIAFAEQLRLGSLLGAVIIVAGLYCVLWGKRSEDHLELDAPIRLPKRLDDVQNVTKNSMEEDRRPNSS